MNFLALLSFYGPRVYIVYYMHDDYFLQTVLTARVRLRMARVCRNSRDKIYVQRLITLQGGSKKTTDEMSINCLLKKLRKRLQNQR